MPLFPYTVVLKYYLKRKLVFLKFSMFFFFFEIDNITPDPDPWLWTKIQDQDPTGWPDPDFNVAQTSRLSAHNNVENEGSFLYSVVSMGNFFLVCASLGFRFLHVQCSVFDGLLEQYGTGIRNTDPNRKLKKVLKKCKKLQKNIYSL